MYGARWIVGIGGGVFRFLTAGAEAEAEAETESERHALAERIPPEQQAGRPQRTRGRT